MAPALPPVHLVRQVDTHRLIPSRHLPHGESVLAGLAEQDDDLQALFDLDAATNDRLLAHARRLPGIGVEELVFAVPHADVVNAAFCHPHPLGARFSGPERGAWYAGFDLRTSQARSRVPQVRAARRDRAVRGQRHVRRLSGRFQRRVSRSAGRRLRRVPRSEELRAVAGTGGAADRARIAGRRLSERPANRVGRVSRASGRRWWRTCAATGPTGSRGPAARAQQSRWRKGDNRHFLRKKGTTAGALRSVVPFFVEKWRLSPLPHRRPEQPPRRRRSPPWPARPRTSTRTAPRELRAPRPCARQSRRVATRHTSEIADTETIERRPGRDEHRQERHRRADSERRGGGERRLQRTRREHLGDPQLVARVRRERVLVPSVAARPSARAPGRVRGARRSPSARPPPASGWVASSRRSRREIGALRVRLRTDRDVFAGGHRQRAGHHPAVPASSTSCGVGMAAATPTMRLAVETMPSFAPRTAARSQPIRQVRCRSRGSTPFPLFTNTPRFGPPERRSAHPTPLSGFEVAICLTC